MSTHDCAAAGQGQNGGEWTVDTDLSVQALIERQDCPPLAKDVLARLLSWQVRVETPVKRALSSPRLAPPFVAVLLALGSDVTVERGTGAERVALREFVEGGKRGQVSVVHVPICRGNRRCGQATVARTPADEPIVAAYAVVEMAGEVVDKARVALTGVWSRPASLAAAPEILVGRPPSHESVNRVASAVGEEVSPAGDYLGSAEYRRAMAVVLTRRALMTCLPGEGAVR